MPFTTFHSFGRLAAQICMLSHPPICCTLARHGDSHGMSTHMQPGPLQSDLRSTFAWQQSHLRGVLKLLADVLRPRDSKLLVWTRVRQLEDGIKSSRHPFRILFSSAWQGREKLIENSTVHDAGNRSSNAWYQMHSSTVISLA